MRSLALRSVFVLLLGFILGGCANRPPQAELQAYLSAVDAASRATDAVLEEWAVAERHQNLAGANAGEGDADAFDPDLAAYYSATGEPPLAAALRRGFRTVERFNAVVVVLAEGRSWQQAAPQVDQFARSASALAAVATGGAAAVVLPAAAPLRELAAALKAADDRLEFERVIQERSGAVLEVIDAMIAATSNMYSVMTEPIMKEADAAADAGDRIRYEQILARRDGYRRMLAEWVVLLNDVKSSLIDLREAVALGAPSVPDLAELAGRSEELTRQAVAVRAAVLAVRDR
jgi:hypothetical protein